MRYNTEGEMSNKQNKKFMVLNKNRFFKRNKFRNGVFKSKNWLSFTKLMSLRD